VLDERLADDVRAGRLWVVGTGLLGSGVGKMKPKTVKIDPAIEPILRGGLKVAGDRVQITQQLDRAAYVAANKVLEALGGKWNRSAKAHIFQRDAQSILDEALGNGQTEVIDTKKTFQQFDTPIELASEMAILAEIGPDTTVLEPSAGAGRLLLAALESARMENLTAIELDAERSARLVTRFVGALIYPQADFLEWADRAAGHRAYDVVLMNPPFAGNQDIAHVRRAWQFLKPGGRLVAIMSLHSAFASDRASQEFRGWLSEIEGTTRDVAPGTFSESGTEVRAQLIFARKRR
jgi:predicted RNA methylase